MRTLANRVKDGLERLGYEFNQNGQFSVELANNAVVVSEKIDLSQITKEKDNINILYFLNEPRFGGPMQISRLAVTVDRYPSKQPFGKSIPHIQLVQKEYLPGNIPTKAALLDMISEKMNISNTQIVDIINKRENQLEEDKRNYKSFMK